MISPHDNGFKAELILDEDFFSTGNAKICVFYQHLKILEKSKAIISDLNKMDFFKNFNGKVIMLNDPIASFSKFSTGNFLAQLSTITQLAVTIPNVSNEYIDEIYKSLDNMLGDSFYNFMLGLKFLSYGDVFPDEFDSKIYLKKIFSVNNKIKAELKNKASNEISQLVSLLNTTETSVVELLNQLYVSLCNELNKAVEDFQAISENSTEERSILAADILGKVKQIKLFGEYFLSSGKCEFELSVREKENNVMATATKLLDNYYSKSKLTERHGQDVIPVAARYSVNQILDLLARYEVITAGSQPIITLEAVCDYEKQYGFYRTYRVCLLQDGRILKAINIPSEFVFLVKNHLIDESIVHADPNIYKRRVSGCYDVYQWAEGVSKRSFMANISRYFYLHNMQSDGSREMINRWNLPGNLAV